MKVTYIERPPGSGTWRIRMEVGRTEDGKRLFKYETLQGNEEAAQRRKWEIETAHEEGSFAPPEKVTLGAWMRQWVKSRYALKKIRRSSFETYNDYIDLYIAPTLGGKRVQKITGAEIQSLYTDLATKARPLKKAPLDQSSLTLVHSLLSSAFKAARKAKVLKANPMEEVDPPAKKKSKPKAIQEAQAVPLLQSLVGNWKWPITVASLGAGLRRGEVLGLRWRYVDLDRGKIVIAGQLVEYRDGTMEWAEPKSESGLRTISIGAELIGMFRQLKMEAYQWRLKNGLGRDGMEDAYVFPWKDGVSPIPPSTLSNSFSDHCDAHGLPEFTFHGTRHTHLTELLRKVGKSGARAVQERAGHSDITTTLRTYQTVFENDDQELADMTSGLLGFKMNPKS